MEDFKEGGLFVQYQQNLHPKKVNTDQLVPICMQMLKKESMCRILLLCSTDRGGGWENVKRSKAKGHAISHSLLITL